MTYNTLMIIVVISLLFIGFASKLIVISPRVHQCRLYTVSITYLKMSIFINQMISLLALWIEWVIYILLYFNEQSYKAKDVAAVTQMPLPHTQVDMWRLAADFKCNCIIMLNEISPDSDVSVYDNLFVGLYCKVLCYNPNLSDWYT